MPDGCVDLILTDPPFQVRKDKWDVFEDDFEFKYFTGRWLKQSYRVSPIIITFFADKYVPLLRAVAEEVGVPYRRALLWDKPAGSQYNGASKDGYWYDFEIIQVFGEPKRKIEVKHTKKGVLKYRTVINQQHGCEKPLELMENILENYSQEGDLILDPFAGSGTTAVAAKQLNRRFIGFEINQKYVDIANERLKQGVFAL